MITLDAALIPVYLDNEGNFRFKEMYLEEEVTVQHDHSTLSLQTDDDDEKVRLLAMIKDLQQQLNVSKTFNLCDAEKKFNLEKFNGKGDAESWLAKFIVECDRYDLAPDDKLRVMRVFLKDSALDWYLSSMKLGLNDWDSVSQSFTAVFTTKNWASIRYAVQYKYIGGSLVDYLLIKQRLLLDIEKEMTQISMINLMVIGLPPYVQNRLKRAEVTSVNKLFEEVANLDSARPSLYKNVKPNSLIAERDTDRNNKKRIPCSICESLNYFNRFHPIQFCRNKNRDTHAKKINTTVFENDEGSTYEILNINKSKKSLSRSAARDPQKLIKIYINVKDKVFEALYDNGSTVSLIQKEIIDKLSIKFVKSADRLNTLSGTTIGAGRAKLKLRIGDIEEDMDFFVIDNSTFKYKVLLGLDAIKKFKLIQDENLNILQRRHIDGNCSRIKKVTDNYVRNNSTDSNYKLVKFNKGNFITALVNACEEKDYHLSAGEKKQISKLIEDNIDCFAVNKYDVGNLDAGYAHIKLMEEKYISQRPYRCSLPDRIEIEKQVSELLKAGLVSESSSPFAAPVTLAYKKGEGKTRLCIDFRQLNKLVVPEAQPFPRIEDMLAKCYDCSYFSVLDANSAFWSIPIVKEDREKLAFVTETGHYQFNVLPFGFKNSPAIFQRIITSIIRRNNLSAFTINFIDDILIFSHTFEEHMQHLQRFFQAVKKEKFKLKLTKCKFAQQSVKYLGHIVEKNRILPLTDNLQAIKNFPVPTKKKNVRQFLGKVNFYHKFIEDCSRKLRPLFDLLKKDAVFKWTEECQKCFDMIKLYMCSPPVLAIFNPNKNIYIYTDASGEGLGAILKQESEDGLLHPVFYFSKRLTASQRKKAPIYLECLAIKEAILFWQHLLIGREFTVVSDHKPLENLKVRSRPDEALGNLILQLTQYNFKIIYQQGKKNIEADALSRNPVLETFEMEDKIRVTNVVDIEEIKQDQVDNGKELKANKRIKIDNDIIFKLKNGRKKLFISENLATKLIERVHKRFGHIGSRKMIDTIRQFYYFKNLDKMVIDYCNRCTICIKNKSRTKRRMGLLSNLGPPKAPFELMSLDTVGGFSKHGKKYLHILIDHFTRYCWVRVSASQNSNDFKELLRKVVRDHDVQTVLADRYPAIDSWEFRKFIKQEHITLVFTGKDCAWSNGMVERVNQTLVNNIRCLINTPGESRRWHTLVADVVDTYNETIHSVTGFSPAYLLYGQDINICPVDMGEQDLLEDRRKAYENSVRYFQKNKERTDQNKKFKELKIGDEVFVDSGNKLNRWKLDEVRKGPYKIVDKVSPLMYKLDGTKKFSKIVHKNKLVSS